MSSELVRFLNESLSGHTVRRRAGQTDDRRQDAALHSVYILLTVQHVRFTAFSDKFKRFVSQSILFKAVIRRYECIQKGMRGNHFILTTKKKIYTFRPLRYTL